MNELTVDAKIESLDEVQAFIARALAGCAQKTRNQIAIAVDEIFSNIVRYAYAHQDGRAVVRVAAGADAVTIEFEDSGAEYNPLAQEDPDVSLALDEREAGGLGIFMVKNLMDDIEYRREGNKNILTIKKLV